MYWGIILIVLGILFLTGVLAASKSFLNMVEWRGCIKLPPAGNRVALFLAGALWLGIGISMVSGVL